MYEWNIPKVISTIAIESLSGTRAFGDFAIDGKTLVHFGINVMEADRGGTYAVNPDD